MDTNNNNNNNIWAKGGFEICLGMAGFGCTDQSVWERGYMCGRWYIIF
jgi:hypothetical protein